MQNKDKKKHVLRHVFYTTRFKLKLPNKPSLNNGNMV